MRTQLNTVIRGILAALTRKPKGSPLPSKTDEFGLPLTWRRDKPMKVFLRLSAPSWPTFEHWCQERKVRPFPASVATVEAFLRDPPVGGHELYEVWRAINARHEAIFWHVDANPVQVLKFGRE